jgi:hypothetical protein
MKIKIKSYLKLGILLFGILFLWFSCEKDPNDSEAPKHQLVEINYYDINQLPGVENALSKINSSSRNGRQMTTSFGSLDLSNILEYVNTDGKATYSFLINKPVDQDNPYIFENLHLVKISEGYLGYIFRWEPDLETVDGFYEFKQEHFTGTLKHYDLNYTLLQESQFIDGQNQNQAANQNTTDKSSRDVNLTCYTISASMCSRVPYDCFGAICGFSSVTVCYGGGGGGTGFGGEGSGGPGGGGSIITGNDNNSDPHNSQSTIVSEGNATTVTVVPSSSDKVIMCLGDAITPQQKAWLENPDNEVAVKKMAAYIAKGGCETMTDIITDYIDNDITQDFEDFADEIIQCLGAQDLIANTDFQSQLSNLNASLSGDVEKGAEISNSNNTLSFSPKIGSYDHIDLAQGGDIIGGMHTHHDAGYPMFSAEDIYKLYTYKKYANSNVSQYDVLSVVITPNGTYMVKLIDFSLLGFLFQQATIEYGSLKRAIRSLNTKLQQDYKSNSGSNHFMKEFLQALKDLSTQYNLPKVPVQLYEKDNATNTFKKVKLTASETLTKTPCN